MVATNFVVYAGLYLVLFLFNHYVGCYLREDGRLCAPKRSRTVDITCAVGIGLVFVSQFSPLLYYIDAQNIYHRSDTFPLSMVLLLIGMGTETTMMAQFYQKLTMGRRIAMFGCVVLPLSVAACQVFQDDISLISLSVGASMTLLFVVATSAQNRELARLRADQGADPPASGDRHRAEQLRGQAELRHRHRRGHQQPAGHCERLFSGRPHLCV